MKQFVSELKEGDRVYSPFLVKERRLMDYQSRSGKYLLLVLGDRTGEIGAVAWENAEEFAQSCQTGKVVMVMGDVGQFRDNLQIRISQVWPAGDGDYSPGDFVVSTPVAVDEMQKEVEELVQSISDPDLVRLLKVFLESPQYQVFCSAPAAQSIHHNYVGGLLEHSLGVMRLCAKIAEAYPQLDRDIMLAGALLHDIGKSQEIQLVPGIQYSTEGQLLGHIVIGTQMVNDMIAKLPKFDQETRLKLLHIIVSHHGEYEWQSPKRPMFAEAKVVHLADMIDAEIFKYASAVPAEPDGEWSDTVRGLRDRVYLGGRKKGDV